MESITQNTEKSKAYSVSDYCCKLGIYHKLIKPYTPRHNGKVEQDGLLTAD